MARLAGRVAPVVGAACVGPGWGSGNTAAVAHAREGGLVAAVDRDLATAEATKSLTRAKDLACEALAMDLTRAHSMAEAVAQILDLHGQADIKRNNVGRGIRANAIMPRLMDTPLIHLQILGQYASPGDMVQARKAACPMGCMGKGWGVAHGAVFLASDQAAYSTGACLPVGGGISLRGH